MAIRKIFVLATIVPSQEMQGVILFNCWKVLVDLKQRSPQHCQATLLQYLQLILVSSCGVGHACPSISWTPFWLHNSCFISPKRRRN